MLCNGNFRVKDWWWKEASTYLFTVCNVLTSSFRIHKKRNTYIIQRRRPYPWCLLKKKCPLNGCHHRDVCNGLVNPLLNMLMQVCHFSKCLSEIEETFEMAHKNGRRRRRTSYDAPFLFDDHSRRFVGKIKVLVHHFTGSWAKVNRKSIFPHHTPSNDA